jgi:hypothetical protein
MQRVLKRMPSLLPGEYAIYLDGSGGSAELTLELPKGHYAGEWTEVTTGAVLRSENFVHSGGAGTLQAPAFTDGAALRLVNH